jgi:TetR/AcrR family transcriptional regulator, cholesterol catabolism regulator
MSRAVSGDGSGGNPRRAQIIEIAAELFDRDGFHDTTMQAIADRAGVRKASLYYYFRSKDDILVELHRTLTSVVVDRQRERVAVAELGPGEQLRAMMRDVIGLGESHPGYLRIFFESHRALPTAVREVIAVQRADYRRMLRDVLVAGVAAGEFVVVDAELATLAALSLMNWTYQWFDRSGRLSASDVADQFYAILLGGISA